MRCYHEPPVEAEDYEVLHSIVFQPDYLGYKPEVKEVPNGDGKVDLEKRYAHVADKYLAKMDHDLFSFRVLDDYLEAAHGLAIRVAKALGVPQEFLPLRSECALRVLEYPPGVGGHAHTDFDLFTLSLYRSEPARLVLVDGNNGLAAFGLQGPPPALAEAWIARENRLCAARALNPGLHIGELGELIGLGEATRHHVEPSTETQYSIVYFALPSPDAVIRTEKGYSCAMQTAGEWLAERYARSRVAA